MPVSEDIISTPKRRLKVASNISIVVIGLVFIISGVTKVVDPWGTSLKIDEYFTLYGMDILMPASMWLAIWMSSAELMMGCMLYLKVRIRMVSTFVLFSLTFFTVLTFLSATVFKVQDCGCFGEVLQLTPWQSFFKNLLLLPCAITVWWRYRRDSMFNFNSVELCAAAILFFTIFGTSLYSFLNLPLVDLLPYSRGVDLAFMVKQQHATLNKSYESVLVYRNVVSGEVREFSIDDSEWHDATKWEWVETKSVQHNIITNEEPIASPFAIVDSRGDDVTLDLISEGQLHMICITRFDAIGRTCSGNIVRYIDDVQSRDGHVVIITPDDISRCNIPVDVDCYNIDPITMRNALRAKIGVIKLVDGRITNKINCRNM